MPPRRERLGGREHAHVQDPPSAVASPQELQAHLDQQHIQMVDLKFSDLWGRWHHVTIPAQGFGPHILRDGIGFDGSSVGLKSVKAGDMVLLPDLSAAFKDPFWEVPTLSLICSAYEADTKQSFPRDPRNIAMRVEQVMRDAGVADESRWGPEFEFYVFDEVAFENATNRASTVWTAAKQTGGRPQADMAI
ncbi:MAG: glutamine synthetase beta-grasp domain-containing protein [Chloroflexi bacterium]|nr:glutamine synthetase beta-grasp domain-containing protein [Chloroflexota bacterium]